MKQALLIVAAALVITVVLAAGFVALHEPASREVTDLKIEATPERLARGEYLVHNVSGCFHCHTEFDQTKRRHPITGPEGAGGMCLTPEIGFPGSVCTPNITQDVETGIGAWTDDEILRAFREGISREGRALFPMMPYNVFKEMSDEDAYSIVAYLRTVEPVNRPEPHATKIDFPVNFFIEFEPQPVEAPVIAPDRNDQVAWGGYMATIAGCRFCHLEGKGGEEFETLAGVVRSSNITTAETGVLPPTAEGFVRMFHSYRNGALAEGHPDEDYTVMGWRDYANMTEEDLRAIHAWFKQVEPVENQVQTYSVAAAE